MNKRHFVLLVILTSLSLIGIISVQVYWIQKSVDDKQEQFSNAVQEILDKVAERVEQRERKDYMNRLVELVDSIDQPKTAKFREILFFDRDTNSDEIRLYSHGILEESYDISSTFFDNALDDSTEIKNFTSTRTSTVYKENYGLDGKHYTLTPLQRVKKIGGLSSVEKAAYEDVFMEAAKTMPIHKRVSNQELELLLNREFRNRAIEIDYEYGIYSRGFPTKVKSKKFKFDRDAIYETPIFKDSDGQTNFALMINFPEKKKFLLSSILSMAVLSLLFTLVIVVAYSSAIYQLIQQKKISEIKSDFINNMTHEFKTPIATINLAVEAIRNPKSIDDKDKIMRYLGMIREENKRMHSQVENVLRISQLEKNQLDINKDRIDIHDIINDAISHVDLIVKDRGGYIHTHLHAGRSDVLANDIHFTSVVVNMLDNAIKYSPKSPQIDVFTEVANNFVLIKVQDQGLGMSKAVQKRIFEKFYREHTGNIHNVKGHGLGLAYVKKIIEDHQGSIFVESEKGKGSTFHIKLPLI